MKHSNIIFGIIQRSTVLQAIALIISWNKEAYRGSRGLRYFLRGAVGAGLTALAMMTSIYPVAAEQPGVDNSKDIIAVVPKDFAPNYLLDNNGDPTGFAIDVMNALARKIGVNVRYVVKDSWKEVNTAILNGEADVIPILGITRERDRYGNFTAPVETFNIVIFVREGDTSINDASQLSGRKVGAVETNVGVGILRSLGNVDTEVFADLPSAFYALLSGQINALVYPDKVLWRFAQEVGNEDRIKVVGAPLMEIKRAIFVRLGRTDLLIAFNQVLEEFVRSEKYQTIFNKWYGKKSNYWTTSRIFTLTGSVSIVLVFLILVLSNRKNITINKTLNKTLANLEASQSQLHKKEATYRSLYVNSPVAFFSISATDGAILNCNEAASNLTGYSTDELRTMKVLELYAGSPDGLDKAAVIFEHFRNGQRADQEQLQIKRKDGAVTWVSLSINPITDGEGNIIESRSVLTDISELKNAELEASLSRERFRVLAESAPVGIFQADAFGAFTFVNDACLERTGRYAEELHGDGWQRFIVPPARDRVILEWQDFVKTGDPFESEFRLLKPDKEEVSVIARAVSERNAAGNITSIIGSVTDITAISRAKSLTKESEQRFSVALGNIPDVIVLYDTDLRIQYINAATQELSGRPESDFIGKRDVDIWPPNIYQTYLPTLKEARDTGKVCTVSTVLDLSDEGARHLEIKCVPILNEDGSIRQIMGVTHDLTEITRAQNELLKSEVRYSKAMQAVNDGLWDWDLLTNEIYYSLPWKRILGYQDSEIANEFNEWERRVHPDDLPGAQREIDHCIKNPEAPLEIEFRMQHKNGSWIDILFRASVLTDDAGKAVQLIGTHVDITERKANEREILRLNAIRNTISQCNSALVHIADEHLLLQKMCDILVNTRGYDLSWIGYANDDPEKSVSPVAAAGAALDYVNNISVHWGDDDLGCGPTGTAIRTGKIQVISDLEKTASFAPWLKKAKKWSFRTSIALPLMGEDTAFGALNIYSTNVNVFDDSEVNILREFSEDLAFGINVIRGQRLHDETQSKLSKTLLETIGAIAMTVEKRDPYTAGHQTRVAKLSVEIARSLGWDKDRVEGLRLGATIHDIGKIYIPAEILNRPGKLSEHEFGMIKTHAEVGHEIIAGVDFPWPVKEMILQHHERLDGTGYPHGLKGDEIVEEAKIIGVADVVEAITSHRPYRPALGIDVGLQEIERGRGTAYDPEIVDACIKVIKEDGFQWDE